jgi:hypothetical protein
LNLPNFFGTLSEEIQDILNSKSATPVSAPLYIPRVRYPGELFGLLFSRMDAARCLRIFSEVFVELRAELSGEVRVEVAKLF